MGKGVFLGMLVLVVIVCGIYLSNAVSESGGIPQKKSTAMISAGWGHTCALTQAGGVKCWGRNFSGQLGDGTNKCRTTPVDVLGLAGGMSAVSTGDRHTCAVTQSGGVKCWGWNEGGQLGDGTTKSRTTPVDVVGLSGGVTTVSTGDSHSCALTQSGGVKCWGWNEVGQLGDETTEMRTTPVDVIGLSNGVTAVLTGRGHTCALTRAGGVKCWGWNVFGQLGDGTTENRTSPVDVVGLSSGVTAISAGGFHTCALTRTGLVKCWGRNEYGQLGDRTTKMRTTPVAVVGLPRDVTSVSVGYEHTCALTQAGSVKCWGWNEYGQLGDGTKGDGDEDTYDNIRPTPVGVVGLSGGVIAVSTGYRHTCVVTQGGGVKCWGYNEDGQLGDGTTTNRTTPVDVVGLTFR